MIISIQYMDMARGMEWTEEVQVTLLAKEAAISMQKGQYTRATSLLNAVVAQLESGRAVTCDERSILLKGVQERLLPARVLSMCYPHRYIMTREVTGRSSVY